MCGQTTGHEMKELLSSVRELAREAGRKVMEIYEAGEIVIQSKSDNSPLTEADLVSHHTIVAGIALLTPEIPILSEESLAISYETRQQWQRYWLIDPLDGTKEFLNRNGEFTVNIALIDKGVPILGVVHAPALNSTYLALQGTGAFRQQGESEPVAIKVAPHDGHNKINMVGSRSHGDARVLDLLASLGGGALLSMGSSLKLCLVAEGKAHLYPRLGPTMEWDTAAAHCVVLEAGGVVCTQNGVALRYNKPDLHNAPFFVLTAESNLLLEKINNWQG
jgi:3'(2'), 5'-bisphosphate nucleotidase